MEEAGGPRWAAAEVEELLHSGEEAVSPIDQGLQVEPGPGPELHSTAGTWRRSCSQC